MQCLVHISQNLLVHHATDVGNGARPSKVQGWILKGGQSQVDRAEGDLPFMQLGSLLHRNTADVAIAQVMGAPPDPPPKPPNGHKQDVDEKD